MNSAGYKHTRPRKDHSTVLEVNLSAYCITGCTIQSKNLDWIHDVQPDCHCADLRGRRDRVFMAGVGFLRAARCWSFRGLGVLTLSNFGVVGSRASGFEVVGLQVSLGFCNFRVAAGCQFQMTPTASGSESFSGPAGLNAGQACGDVALDQGSSENYRGN